MTSTSSSSSKECHILPCKIDYSGKVSDYIYFHPQNLDDFKVVPEEQESAAAESDCSGAAAEGSFRAVQFRGRGLLSYDPPVKNRIGADDGGSEEENADNNSSATSYNKLNGRLLVVSKRKSPGGSNSNMGHKEVEVVGSFDRITEWHHEHLPSKVKAAVAGSEKRRGGGGGSAGGGASAAQRVAMEWCQIASALHAPVPVDDEE